MASQPLLTCEDSGTMEPWDEAEAWRSASLESWRNLTLELYVCLVGREREREKHIQVATQSRREVSQMMPTAETSTSQYIRVEPVI